MRVFCLNRIFRSYHAVLCTLSLISCGFQFFSPDSSSRFRPGTFACVEMGLEGLSGFLVLGFYFDLIAPGSDRT
ncbi:unnamed protein product [Amoebophrya sp. A120]|nr:unnamed protein product [Amoebophrya sp. A120]|eukprot:GSA120T00018165001.1